MRWKAVVDDGPPVGAPVIVVHRPPEALPPVLDGERDDGGGSAGGGGAGSGVEVVRAHRAVERALVEVTVRVHPARSHGASRRVDDPRSVPETIRKGGDLSVANPDVAMHHVGRGGDPPAADDDVEFTHARYSLDGVWCLFVNGGRRASARRTRCPALGCPGSGRG